MSWLAQCIMFILIVGALVFGFNFIFDLPDATREFEIAELQEENANLRQEVSQIQSVTAITSDASADQSANEVTRDEISQISIAQQPIPGLVVDIEELTNVYCGNAKDVISSNVFNLSTESFNAEYQLTCSNIQESISQVSAYSIDREIVRITAQFRLVSNQNQQITKLYNASWATTKTSYNGLDSNDAISGIIRDLENRVKIDRHLFLGE